MKNLFVSYETALALKEKGFNEPCLAWYYSDRSALGKLHLEYSEPNTKYHLNSPTYDQVTSWFREKYRIGIYVRGCNKVGNFGGYEYIIGDNAIVVSKYNNYENYYEALNKAIEEALKLI